MCSNSPSDENNAFFPAEESSPTFTLEYGPYMNWGRWNHNTRRIQGLIDFLINEGFSVQLKHDEKETDRNDHGWVRILSEEGIELAFSKEAQHNRVYWEREKMLEDMGKAAIKAFQANEH